MVCPSYLWPNLQETQWGRKSTHGAMADHLPLQGRTACLSGYGAQQCSIQSNGAPKAMVPLIHGAIPQNTVARTC